MFCFVVEDYHASSFQADNLASVASFILLLFEFEFLFLKNSLVIIVPILHFSTMIFLHGSGSNHCFLYIIMF